MILEVIMRTLDKIVFRGYAKQEEDIWVAICIDLNIAAQGNTVKEAMDTCSEMISEYIEFVCKQYPDKLGKYIPRPAPKEFIEEYNQMMKLIIGKEESKKIPSKLWSYESENLALCGA